MQTDAFLAKFDGDGLNCWEWRAYRSRDGYGYVRHGGVPTCAHRVAYEMFVGPIPEGLTIDHLCRNRGCVNPAHLEAVTCAENIRRGSRATRQHCSEGHAYTPDNIFAHSNGGRGCRTCKRRRDAAYRAKKRS